MQNKMQKRLYKQMQIKKAKSIIFYKMQKAKQKSNVKYL